MDSTHEILYGAVAENSNQVQQPLYARDILSVSIAAAAAAAMLLAGKVVLDLVVDDQSSSAMHLSKKIVDALGTAGFVFLAGTLYGIVNDIRACHQCIEYFTVGHTTMHKRIVPSDHPITNALAWGMWGSLPLSLVASVVVAIAELAMNGASLPNQNIDIYAGMMLFAGAVTLLVAERRAANTRQYWSRDDQQVKLNAHFDAMYLPARNKKIHALCCCVTIGGFQDVELSRVPQGKRAAYMATGARNITGYVLLPAMATLIVLARIVVRTLAHFDNTLAESSLLSLSRF